MVVNALPVGFEANANPRNLEYVTLIEEWLRTSS
jgi:hypothetical protein